MRGTARKPTPARAGVEPGTNGGAAEQRRTLRRGAAKVSFSAPRALQRRNHRLAALPAPTMATAAITATTTIVGTIRVGTRGTSNTGRRTRVQTTAITIAAMPIDACA